MQEITLTQNTFKLFPTVYAVQNDTGRELKMIIQDQTLLLGDTGAVAVQRSDGSYYTIAATLNVLDNAFTADISQALTQPGRTLCQLKVTRSGLVVSSYTFAIMVQPSTDGVPSEQLGVSVDELMAAADQLIYASSDTKVALLQIAEKTAYIDANGQDYYNALFNALYPPIRATSVSLNTNSLVFSSTNVTQTLTATVLPNNHEDTLEWGTSDPSVAVVSDGIVTSVGAGDAIITATCGPVHKSINVTVAQAVLLSISAVYTQSGTVYDTDTLDSLKDDIVVTAYWNDSSQTTVSADDYTLLGTLTVGTSTITVEYGGKTDTISVTVSQNPVLYSLRNQVMTTSSQFNTGLYLLSEDKDFTIAYDVTLTAKNSAWKIAYIYETASPWRGIMFGVGGSTYRAKYYSAYQDMGAASQITRTRVVATHAAGSGKMVVYYRNNTASSTSTLTVTNSVEQSTYGPLIIGAHTTNTWAGTIAKLDVLNYAMTQQEAEAYITGA